MTRPFVTRARARSASVALAALAALAVWISAAAVARAQTPPSADSTAAAPAGTAAPSPTAAPAPRTASRASWLSDRLPLRVGDLVTIVVDEQTAARERVSTVATGNRDMSAQLNAGLTDDDIRIGPQKSVGTGLHSNSRDVGEANRLGDLTAVLTVRVTAVESDGIYRVEGKKSVVVDGRAQEITLAGLVRGEDVTAGRTVLSGRIADAVITYKGKKIGPRTGIVGKILAMLWP